MAEQANPETCPCPMYKTAVCPCEYCRFDEFPETDEEKPGD